MSAQTLPVSFSTLLISLASAAIMAMGLEKNPHSGQIEKDLSLARFNIDMLKLLKDKTKNNLNAEEAHFLDSAINDLQMKFVHVSQQEKLT
jgi:hypothetical protein